MREELAMEQEQGTIGWVVVTGGGGFIGRHVVDRLLEQRFRVHVVDSRLDLDPFPHSSNMVVWQDDCRSPEVWDAIRQMETERDGVGVRPWAVVHLAATVSMAACERDAESAYRNNVGGTIAAVDGAVTLEAKRFVLASTAAVYPGGVDGQVRFDGWWAMPDNVYGRTKMVAEMEALARIGQVDVQVLRFANVFGPGQHVSAESGVLAKWCSAVARGEVLEVWSDGSEERDFIHVRAVAEVVAQKARGGVETPQIENVSSGTSRKVKDVLADLLTIAAEPVTVRYRPDKPGGVRRSLMPPGETVRRHTTAHIDWTDDLAGTLAHYRDTV